MMCRFKFEVQHRHKTSFQGTLARGGFFPLNSDR